LPKIHLGVESKKIHFQNICTGDGQAPFKLIRWIRKFKKLDSASKVRIIQKLVMKQNF